MMAKKSTLIITAVVILVLGVGVGLLIGFLRGPIYPAYDPNHPTAAQQKAIDDAIRWHKNNSGLCGAAITPAVDPATGARHGFSDTCLPPGWKADYQTSS